MMVWQKTFAPRVNLASTINGGDPGENMFDNALVYLMKDVGCDGSVDINVGKLLPEWVNDRFNVIVITIFSKLD